MLSGETGCLQDYLRELMAALRNAWRRAPSRVLHTGRLCTFRPTIRKNLSARATGRVLLFRERKLVVLLNLGQRLVLPASLRPESQLYDD